MKNALKEIVEKIPDLTDQGKPVVVTKEMTDDQAKEQILKIIPILNQNDYFTNETKEVLAGFGWTRETGWNKPIKESEIIDIPKKLNKKILDAPIKAPTIEELKKEIESMPIVKMKSRLISTIKTRPPFSNLFSINKDTLLAITASMKKNGYDEAYPVILWKDLLIDGHTRMEAAFIAGIDTVPVEVKEFDSEEAALEYAIHNQRDRRNISESDLLKAISIIDTPMSKIDAGAKGGKAEGEKIEPSHKKTAKILGIGESKVTDARTVMTDEEAVKEVQTGKKTIREAAKEVRDAKRKPKEEVLATLTPIECVVKVLRENAGNEMTIGSINEESSKLINDDFLDLEAVVYNVIDVLMAIGLVTIKNGDVITIKKSIK